jgi:hypothetical protein
MKRRAHRLVLAGMAIVGFATMARADDAVEPTFETCWNAVDAAERQAQSWPKDNALRQDAERLIRQGRGEGGSGEYDECLEYIEQANQLLSGALAPKDVASATRL